MEIGLQVVLLLVIIVGFFILLYMQQSSEKVLSMVQEKLKTMELEHKNNIFIYSKELTYLKELHKNKIDQADESLKLMIDDYEKRVAIFREVENAVFKNIAETFNHEKKRWENERTLFEKITRMKIRKRKIKGKSRKKAV